MANEVPPPDSEVPKDERDKFFNQMRTKQSERVRRRLRAIRVSLARLG